MLDAQLKLLNTLLNEVLLPRVKQQQKNIAELKQENKELKEQNKKLLDKILN